MTEKELVNIIQNGENERVEFKSSFNKTVIETLVAFSNTHGGKVLLGVDNKGNIKGMNITEESVQKWVNEIKQNTIPQIVPDIQLFEINSKQIIVLSVVEYPVKPVSYKDRYYKRVPIMVEFIITGEAQRIERYDYPLEAIREIVINMLVHRDYRDSSGSIIKIYDDRIGFFNPGGLYGGLTLNDFVKF